MTKIIACGDSFLTPDRRYPGGHFTELLAEKYGYEVINLARGGISNIGIGFQMELAISLNPNIIILAPTGSDRMQVPVGKFNPSLGLKNIRYTDFYSATCGSVYVGTEDSAIVDDVVYTIANDCDWTVDDRGQKYKLSPEKKEAVKYYITHLRDEELQKVTDRWIIDYWTMQARTVGIRIIFLSEIMDRFYIQYNTSWDDIGVNIDTIFHANLDSQKLIVEVADKIIKNN